MLFLNNIFFFVFHSSVVFFLFWRFERLEFRGGGLTRARNSCKMKRKVPTPCQFFLFSFASFPLIPRCCCPRALQPTLKRRNVLNVGEERDELFSLRVNGGDGRLQRLRRQTLSRDFFALVPRTRLRSPPSFSIGGASRNTNSRSSVHKKTQTFFFKGFSLK